MMPVPRHFDLFVKPCKKCGAPKARLACGQFVCRPCRAEREREQHANCAKTARKQISRVKAYKGLLTGKLTKLPCEICGDPNSEMHHWDYSKPYDVTFFCKVHHAEIEAAKRAVAA
jgi:hypothetical protein